MARLALVGIAVAVLHAGSAAAQFCCAVPDSPAGCYNATDGILATQCLFTGHVLCSASSCVRDTHACAQNQYTNCTQTQNCCKQGNGCSALNDASCTVTGGTSMSGRYCNGGLCCAGPGDCR